jgi:hypothetical protein
MVGVRLHALVAPQPRRVSAEADRHQSCHAMHREVKCSALQMPLIASCPLGRVHMRTAPLSAGPVQLERGRVRSDDVTPTPRCSTMA